MNGNEATEEDTEKAPTTEESIEELSKKLRCVKSCLRVLEKSGDLNNQWWVLREVTQILSRKSGIRVPMGMPMGMVDRPPPDIPKALKDRVRVLSEGNTRSGDE